MSKYRFHLQKYSLGSKIACPSCERPRCFVKYVDEEGVVSFPNEVGKCDHEISCGYHYTPRDFFRDNRFAKIRKKGLVSVLKNCFLIFRKKVQCNVGIDIKVSYLILETLVL